MAYTRQQLLNSWWGGALDRAAPTEIIEDDTGGGQIALHPSDIKRAKRLRFQVAGNLWNSVHVYWPTNNEGRRCLLYVSGHSSDWTHNWITVGEAISRGYVVAEMFMLGYKSEPGYNQSFPLTYEYAVGSENIADHDDFAAVHSNGYPVLPAHIDPAIRTIKWLRDNLEPEVVGIVGHSGGGWTALLAGALDTTIDFVASIHGWCPIGASGEPSRDFEQQPGTGLWVDSTNHNYEDYSALVGSRRQLLVTGDDDPVFGSVVLGQSNIDSMVSTLQSGGANIAQQTFDVTNHNAVAAEATWVCDQLDLETNGCAHYVSPRYDSTLANAQQMVSILNQLAALPKKGTGGTLVQVETWDETPPTPDGWTAAYVETDLGGGNGRIDPSAQDYDRLYDAAQVATLSGPDQTFVTTERDNFIGL